MKPLLPVLLGLSLSAAVPQARAQSGLNPFNSAYGLSEKERKAVYDALMEGRAEEKRLRARGRAGDANGLGAILSALEKTPYAHSYAAYMSDDVFAYAHSKPGKLGIWRSIHLKKGFFDLTDVDSRISNPVKKVGDHTEVDEEERARMKAALERKARLEQLTILMHERWHLQYQDALDFGRPEKEAYLLSYQWLLTFGISDEDKSPWLINVRDQLKKEGVTEEELKKYEVPEDAPAESPLSDEAAVCASMAAALERDAAKKDDPQRKHKMSVSGYAYDPEKKCCVGSHRLLQSSEGGPWAEVFTFYSPENPACVSLDQARTWFKASYPDLKW